MVITGPLQAQPITKIPIESEITKAFNALKQVGSGSNQFYGKQMYGDYPYGNNYVQQKNYDIPMDKSWKYNSTFSDIFATVPQQNNHYDTNIRAYPVDNEKIIPTTSSLVPLKEASNIFDSYTKDPLIFDNSIPGKLDFDLSAFFAAPFFPKQEASPEYIIPDQPLEFNYGNTTPVDENITDNSTGIWGETISKETSNGFFQNGEQTVDPFVNNLQTQPRLYPTPSTDSLLSDTTRQASPVSVATMGSPMSQDSPWEDPNFQQLLDASLTDMDFFLPPPPKRIHDSPEPVMMSPQYPSSPETIQEASSMIESTKDDYVKPKPQKNSQPATEKSKTKSTILFGKHEDEIIHKLLVPELSTPSGPVTRDKLVSIPVEEFNQLLEQANLNDIEIAFMKEWRRRGKNKTAAQIARKRKREEVGDLELEVEAMRQQKVELQMKYNQLQSQIKSLKERSLAAEGRVYKQYSHRSGQLVSRDTHLIHVAQGNKLLLVPKITSQIISVN